MDSYERVHEYFGKLGLTTMENIIDSYLEASHDRLVIDILDHLLSEELKHKLSRKTENMLNWSGFPFRKTMDDFDFPFQPSIDRSVIDDLMTLRFMHNTENVVFLGPPGVGKTHLSIALGMRAIMSDIPVYYISAMKAIYKGGQFQTSDFAQILTVFTVTYPDSPVRTIYSHMQVWYQGYTSPETRSGWGTLQRVTHS